jgi:succinoglycan biosynthesis transport protein ExoP
MSLNRLSRSQQAGVAEQISEYWDTIKHHRWMIYFLALTLTAVSVIGISLLPDVYQATTTILVDSQKVSDELIPASVKSELTERLQNISQEVLGSTHLQRVMDENNLYPKLRKSMSTDQLLEYMRSQIQITVKRASGSGPASFSITYEGRDPFLTAKVTRELAAEFVNWNLNSRSALTENTAAFLDNRLATAQNELKRQETQVREFKMRHLGEMPEETQSNIAQLSQLRASFSANNDTLNRLEQERIELEELPQTAHVAQLVPMPISDRARLQEERVRAENRLTELRRRYMPKHPEVLEAEQALERIDRQIAGLPPDKDPTLAAKQDKPEITAAAARLSAIARETRRLEEEQTRMQLQTAALQAKLDAVPLREQQYADLTRGYDIAKEQYRSLLTKKYSAEMAADLERKHGDENFTVLDAARIPERPFRPNRKLLLASAFLGSWIVPIVLVVGKDQMLTTVKTERHLQKILGPSVLILATIPAVSVASERGRNRQYLRAAVFSTSAIALLLALFLWRVHPIL